MKKLLLILLILVLIGGASFAQARRYRIGVSMPTATHGWMGGANYWARKAIDDWKAKDASLEFFLVTADNVTKQASDIEDLMVRGIDCLVVFPFDASLTSVVERVYNSGVYTVVLDRGTTRPVYDMWLSNDDEGYTRQGMEWLAKELNYRGKVVLIEGIPSPINTIRVNTIREVARKYPGIEILDSQPGEWNRQKALAVMENYLQKYRQIDAVYTADDDMLEGVLQAYRESGRRDLKVALGGAASKAMIKRIIDGDPLVRANVTYPPDVVATGVSMGVLGVQGRTLEGFYQRKLPTRIILSAELITRENAQQYYHPEAPF